MFLLEWTPDGLSKEYLSNQFIDSLTKNWLGYVRSFTLTKSMDKDYGGAFNSKLSQVSIDLADFFQSGSTFPPYEKAAFVAYYTDTTEAAKIELARGTAIFKGFSEDQVDFYTEIASYSDTIASGTAYAAVDIQQVFATLCGAGHLNLTLDTTYARAIPPTVNYTLTTDKNTFDFLSEMAAFFTHCFYVDESTDTLYLIDMLSNKGTASIGWKRFDPSYSKVAKYTSIDCTGQGETSIPMNYPAGSPLSVVAYDNDAGRNAINLTNIRTVLEKRWLTIAVPIEDTLPDVCNLVSFTNDIIIPTASASAVGGSNLVSSIVVRELKYDYVDNKMEISGEGTHTVS